MTHRTIEDRIGEILAEVHQIKMMLAEAISAKPIREKTYASSVQLPDHLMNVKEVAKFCNAEPATIYAACSKREINFLKIGKLYKFKKEDVLTWIEKKEQPTTVDVDDYVNQYLEKNILRG